MAWIEQKLINPWNTLHNLFWKSLVPTWFSTRAFEMIFWISSNFRLVAYLLTLQYSSYQQGSYLKSVDQLSFLNHQNPFRWLLNLDLTDLRLKTVKKRKVKRLFVASCRIPWYLRFGTNFFAWKLSDFLPFRCSDYCNFYWTLFICLFIYSFIYLFALFQFFQYFFSDWLIHPFIQSLVNIV